MAATLYFGTAGTHAINVTLYGKLPFDVIKDFTHVSILGDVPNIMIVNPKIMSTVNACADVMKLAKEKPGELKYASTGNGASTHLAGAIFTKMSGLQIDHIPYRGTPPAMNAMMSGETQVMWHQSLTVMGPIKQGTFKALAVTTRKTDCRLAGPPHGRKGLRSAGIREHHLVWPVRAGQSAGCDLESSEPGSGEDRLGAGVPEEAQ
jgi:tripartite-type tricarboxylate transporter receptor subunit TctC